MPTPSLPLNKSIWTLLTSDVIEFGNWRLKGSLSSFDTYCIVMWNDVTQEGHTRFFLNEKTANKFIDSVVKK